MSNKKKEIVYKDKILTNKLDIKSPGANFIVRKKNQKPVNQVLKKKINNKISETRLLNKKKKLMHQNTESNSLAPNDKKKAYYDYSSSNFKKSFINRKKPTKLVNSQKNNKKNRFYSAKGLHKRSSGDNKKFNSHSLHRSVLQQKFNKPPKKLNKKIIIGDFISVLDLSSKMSVKSSAVINNLLNLGVSATSTHILDQDTAQLVAEEMGHEVLIYRENELEISIMKNRNSGNLKLEKRPPVVTMMGHVDHGKTSLLDRIRATAVASRESGGITQRIGAYHVNTAHGRITFLDTPGHSAFTSMRSRGTQITDIVVLVIAADDGVMQQTIEAIQHAKQANVPIIVAINKIDKSDANVSNIKTELVKHSIISEELGGENIFVPVSAKTGKGVDNLLSTILLQSEILELKSSYDNMASGTVIESLLDNQRGPVATVLIREGTLRLNDIVICGLEYGKIKLMRNEFSENILFATPSLPVEIFGLSGVPKNGDTLVVVHNEKKAKEVSLYRKRKFRDLQFSNQKKMNVENLFNDINVTKESDVNIILKADVQGSLEAILGSLTGLSNSNSQVSIIMSGVGAITETDAYLSSTSCSILIGFNVRATPSAKKIIELESLDVRYYSIIYDLINDIKAVVSGLLTPTHKQQILGLAEVRSIFKSPKFGLIAGCMVMDGIIRKTNPIRVLRNSVVIYEGELESLRRFKEDVLEVRNGVECGIGVKNYNDVQIGDIIELFQIIT
ncbi:translation initiation factor IF-2 [Buchnera aphidicola]|uniref:translation initiation factor IF-2 n=1 Tax=Buchnera aphidicola TaxID=9 RepID=UPI00094D0F51